LLVVAFGGVLVMLSSEAVHGSEFQLGKEHAEGVAGNNSAGHGDLTAVVFEQRVSGRGLYADLEDGFAVRSRDENFELRLRLMQQTDAKLFLPTRQKPARPGLYIPRFRVGFEGHLTESYEYELSLQRSVEGVFDVLDASVTYRPAEAFQVTFGRFLVPYSYNWYDHLEQYFIAPERALFPLNFGLSRQAGLMFHGDLDEGTTHYAIGGFSGQLAGVADTNTTRSVVGYVNWRPFLKNGYSCLRYLNIGASGSVGHQPYAGETLPLRTSVQASENDEAANAASSIFLEFEDDVEIQGGRSSAAAHFALYSGSLSLESEVQYGSFQVRNPTGQPYLDAWGYHVALSYFVTGEEVTDRSAVAPLGRFDPAAGEYGCGAIEPFCRFSQLSIDDTVFTNGLADQNNWARRVSLIDIGWNWYPNEFVKLYLDWQVALFGSPVLIDEPTDRHVGQSHTLWARAQISF